MTRKVLVRHAGVAIVMVVALAACSSSKTSSTSTGTTGGSSGGGSAAALAKAEAATQLAYKGTNRNVSPTPRAAVKGKHIVVISAGQAASSSSVPSNGAVAAAKALGWQVDLYDAKLNPSNYAPLVRQAIAAHVDGIILDAIDCDTVKQPLQEAKAAHIATVGIYAFDCNDPKAGGDPTGLFSATINFGPKATNPDKFSESYGADQANYIIAKTQNKAKVIAIQDPEFTVLYWTLKGFTDTIAASGGSQVVDTVNVTTQDLTNGQIVQKIQAALLQHPEANWVKSPYTYVTTLGVAPALGANTNKVDVMGGEGFSDELNLIRAGKVTAVNVISSEWTGWAASDTMNSVFLNQKPADSGIGWTMVDATHGLPPSGEFIPPVDFKAEYQKAWGVSS
jgi:ribose transport system substrate-binding protein